jgi:hypothetical protein
MTVACAGLAVYAAVLAIPVSVLAVPVKKSYGFSKSGTTFQKVVPLFGGNGYLAAVLATPMCGIATLRCINNGRAWG